jgi:hypothetical protein
MDLSLADVWRMTFSTAQEFGDCYLCKGYMVFDNIACLALKQAVNIVFDRNGVLWTIEQCVIEEPISRVKGIITK